MSVFEHHLCTRDAANADATDGTNIAAAEAVALKNRYFISASLIYNILTGCEKN